MLPSIFLVDDEIEIINALKRVLMGKFEVHGYTDPQQALDDFEKHPSHIFVSDMQMPHMTGAELLTQIAQLNESTKRVILTGYADLELAEAAINQGKVCCYIAKPWDNKKLVKQLNKLVKEIKSERKQRNAIKQLSDDKKKLASLQKNISIVNEQSDQQLTDLKEMNYQLLHVGADLVSFFSQESDHQSARVADQAKLVAKRMAMTPAECQQVYLAGLYHKIGSFGVPDELLYKGWQQMTDTQKSIWAKFAVSSASLLRGAKLLAPSADIISHLFEHVDGTGFPDGLAGDDIPMGSKILSVVLYYDLLVRGDFVKEPVSHSEAVVIINKLAGRLFDRQVTKTFFALIENPSEQEHFERIMTARELAVNMVLSQDVFDENERKLLIKDTQITAKTIDQIATFQQSSKQKLVFYVEWGKSLGGQE
ncbi:two-component system response regulator [Thalassotalea loyana]|uniref:Two-component system response regulator n=1 Tax=Thalassotalea loyana TaxID=280483 RepID=A0ABQ6H9Y7_9GAMM|nr:HD domain-containing phosphohydrolase [Thalassotalea loyana]GLX84943.1 two-component system response regulator [Thalassotalea loyana]